MLSPGFVGGYLLDRLDQEDQATQSFCHPTSRASQVPGVSMCGLAGLLRLDGGPADTETARRMGEAVRHRGPDAAGTWAEGPIALAHRRLAVRDLTPSSAQPFESACGRVVVVYNGEIYNDADIADRLARETGFQRRGTSDTEIIPAAYLAWGLEAIAELNGIFAFALWDRQLRRLVLARDHLGTKPLYVRREMNRWTFGSEIKALLAAGGPRPAFDPRGVSELLAMGAPGPDRTALADVRQVQPGAVLVWENGVVEERRYWQPSRTPAWRDLGEAAEEVAATLKLIVRDQLVSDVPIGALQSGGVDSSLITYALPREQEAPLFCVRFPEASHDESELALRSAHGAGRQLTLVDLGGLEQTRSDFLACAMAVDGQLGDASLLATYQISRAIRSRVVVALSGDGADELFGGYPTYRATTFAARIKPFIAPPLARLAASAARRAAGVSLQRLTKGEIAARFLEGLAAPVPHALWRHYLVPGGRRSLYGPALTGEISGDPFSQYADAFLAASGDPADRGLVADQAYYLPADMLIKVDRASMAHSLEVRLPFLDVRLVALAASLDKRLFFGDEGAETKLVLRRALAILGAPPDVTGGVKKGFNVPINMLLRGALKPLANRFLKHEPDVFGRLIDADGVRALWCDHAAGRVDARFLIWTLLTLGVWMEATGLTAT